ncbi:uncharacterized protein G2W53_010179 [Senna tora]|uniref:Uncharacterized protein n=1 Tax=Senna tora TaxID=362788 RepID=A0A835CB75_9FABA|nr:uncharacterized protein G2W53_010179 [Senna tora]
MEVQSGQLLFPKWREDTRVREHEEKRMGSQVRTEPLSLGAL